ncbi:hypothetical protein I3842_13G168600 [Carya illinoinensis]|uniref:Bromo domain-containing protein n=1 Tax=Carya illinoinensis TaxID=32201 RepID=A0A922DEJ8_CARIL|nr:hypothetical protein I3842_13G168600 [Carya illinoinensis]
MARQHEATALPWGTLEELLLASAVNRHGTASWDSIAIELQNRSSSLPSLLPLTLTPQYCRDKFYDLKRRFLPQQDDESASLVPMVDELRRIRVEELRREVQRRDDSIVSLELKVKSLEEERERSLKEDSEALDLKKDIEGDGREATPLPDNLTGKSVCGDVSNDKENRSFNGSNSTSQGGEGQGRRNGVVGEQERPEPDRNDPDPGRSEYDPGKNYSFDNGEVDDTDDAGGEEDQEIGVKAVRGTGGLGESNEGLESVGESKKEKEAASKQSSDVQSSASLSGKKRRRRDGGGISSGEDPEAEGHEEVSPARGRVLAVKSEPLVKLIGMIRSHRLGSAFERRLRSQESERYKSLIRQHMDLQIVQSRLDRGVYADCIDKFFRDLLLLFNNGVIFFRRSSAEHVAARELRGLVRKELNDMVPKPQTTQVKPEPKNESDSLSKPNKSSTMVACGKQSSMKALITEGANRKVDKRERELEEKPNSSQKKNDGSFVKIEEKGIRKKRTKERLGGRGLRTNNKGGGDIKHEYGGNELSSHDALEVKMEKKENTVKKKQGAASFLKRMKQNSPGEVLADADDSDEDSKDDRSEEKKKPRGRRREVIKIEERVTRSCNGGGRGGKEENTAKVKRGVGRPPKRLESVSAAATGKRGRDNGESVVVGGGGRSRKRSRR